MIAILIKSSVVVALLLAFYKLFLEKESFFSKNRLYLLACLVLAFVLPFITLPRLVPDQGIVSTSIEQLDFLSDANAEKAQEEAIESVPTLSSQMMVKKEESNDLVSIDLIEKNQAEVADNEAITTASSFEKTPPQKSKIAWSQWLLWIYLFGVLVFSLHLLTQLISLIVRIINSSDRIEDSDCTIINMVGMKEPCSFFKYIFINPNAYDYDTYEQILAHERIHVQQGHTLDLLLSEVTAILLWFNPFVWLFRKEVEKNIEYQTDDLLLQSQIAERESYQLNLVRIATHTKPLTVTTNYNQSLIKKRILKMNTQKSNPHSYWKYAFILPTVFGILLILNKPKMLLATNTLEESFSTILDENEPKAVAPKPAPSTMAVVEKTTPKAQQDTNPFEVKSTEPATESVVFEEEKPIFTDNEIEEGTACAKLEKAIKKADVEAVRAILTELDPSCFPKVTMEDFQNFELLRSTINEYSDIFINPKSGSIIVQYTAMTIYDGGLMGLHYEGRRDFEEGFGVKCGEVLKAEKDMDFDKVRALYIDMDADCLKDPTAENVRHLQYMQFLLKNGAKMSLEPKTITINTKSLLGDEDNGGKSSITIAKQEKKYGYSSELPYGNNRFELKQNGSVTEWVKKDNSNEPYRKSFIGKMNKCQQLLSAVGQEDVTVVKRLLESVDVNCTCSHSEIYLLTNSDNFEESRSPLVTAARTGNVEIGELLLEKGAKIDKHVNGDESPLMAASKGGNLAFVKLLVKRGADVNKKVKGDGTPLLVAAAMGQLDVATYLIEKGADVNAVVRGDGTPLINAVRGNHYDVSKLLLEKGASPTLSVPGDENPMYHAKANNNRKMIQLLEKY